MLPLAQTTAPQLPPLPEGPALENVRGPIEMNGGDELWQILLAGLAVLLIVGGLAWLYLRSRKQPAVVIDPKVAALAELDAASQATDDERFALLCANAVRRYLEACLDLPATSRTSAEIIVQLPLESEAKNGIRNFFERCDEVKFARQALSQEQRNELADTAQQLIETLRPKEAAEQA
jgi:hypothetical protein